LFKISIQSVSLWHFHVYMYCIPNWFIPSIFLFSTFMMISTYLKILYPFFFPFYQDIFIVQEDPLWEFCTASHCTWLDRPSFLFKAVLGQRAWLKW
jgi:hypothetical protein